MPRSYNVINVNGHIVPATNHDAFKKVLHDVQTGRIAARSHGRYRSNPRLSAVCMCAIGTFFTNEQLDQIAEARRNNRDVDSLVRLFGRGNVEAMTGLTADMARLVQSDFDFFSRNSGSLHEFSDRIRHVLDTTKRKLNPAIKHTGAWHWPVSGE
jgi:hypothetical protein